MLIQSIHYTFDPGDSEEALETLRELRDLSVQEPGVLRFEVARSKDHPNVFLIWEGYRDEAALAVHVASEHFERLAVNGVRRLAKDRVAEKALLLP